MIRRFPMQSLLLVALLSLSAITSPLSAEEPAGRPGALAQTVAGTVAGGQDGGIRSFLGVPYAAPPVGALRWREPEPPASWNGVRQATSFAPACVQAASPWEPDRKVYQAEDCLYLNIWTPAQAGAEPLPVMVWFHGGGLMVGSGSESDTVGENLARKGVVVVNVNYRLGPLGYLVLPELNEESVHNTSGNYGLLDQIAALKWVRDNIANFGGDPDNVTIFGFSAGSTSVNALQASPLARGLFHRAIGQSTAQMNPAPGIWQLRTFAQAERFGEDYKKALGVDTLAQMRALPAEALVVPPHKFWLIEGDGYALPEEVHDVFAAGRQANVPVLAGATANEETTLAPAEVLSWLKPRSPADEATFTKIYGEEGVANDQTVNDVILWQMREWVRLNKRKEDRSYLYFFTHVPPNPAPEDLGAYHGAEGPYVFQTLGALDWAWTEEDRRLADIVSSYWVNFARTGNPNGPGLPIWPAYSEDTVMELSASPAPTAMPHKDVLEMLDAYFERERARPKED